MKQTLTLSALTLAMATNTLPAQDVGKIQKGEMAGYLLVPNERVPETYNAGFSMYVAAWRRAVSPSSPNKLQENEPADPDLNHETHRIGVSQDFFL